MVICTSFLLLLFYAIFNYQFKTSELKNAEKLVEQTVKALKSCENGLGMCIFVQSAKLHSWKLNVVLKKSSKSPGKMVAIFSTNAVVFFLL